MDDFRDTPCGRGPLGDLSFGGAHGYLERSGDRDIFGLALIAGLTYSFTVEPEGDDAALFGGGAMSVRERHGAVIGVERTGAPLDITAGRTGLHDVVVSAVEPGDTGRYYLSATPGRATEGDDVIRGSHFADRVEGWLGDDTIRGGRGDDILWGDGDFALEGGQDRLFGGAGDDILYGGAGRDVFAGGRGDDYYGDVTEGEIVRERPGGGDDIVFYDGESYVLPDNVERLSIWGSDLGRDAFGNGLDNWISGNDNANRLFGLGGDDAIDGHGGDDLLTGGRGADRISGGPGEDIFRFRAGDSPTRFNDAIVADHLGVAFEGAGVAGGDRIDLSALDADPDQPGRQALSFAAESGPGRVWAVDGGAATLIRADLGGPLGPEITIRIEDGAEIAAADYAAEDFIL